MDRADAEGLGSAEREDYCLSETVAKKLVPDTHINDAVGRIQVRPRVWGEWGVGE